MTTLNICLTFNGNCLEAFNFCKSIFGGDFPYVGKYKDKPMNNTFWGDYFGMFTDKFGINWMVSFATAAHK